jgi:hypothetical protein
MLAMHVMWANWGQGLVSKSRRYPSPRAYGRREEFIHQIG